jgi:hypothetical protein
MLQAVCVLCILFPACLDESLFSIKNHFLVAEVNKSRRYWFNEGYSWNCEILKELFKRLTRACEDSNHKSETQIAETYLPIQILQISLCVALLRVYFSGSSGKWDLVIVEGWPLVLWLSSWTLHLFTRRYNSLSVTLIVTMFIYTCPQVVSLNRDAID